MGTAGVPVGPHVVERGRRALEALLQRLPGLGQAVRAEDEPDDQDAQADPRRGQHRRIRHAGPARLGVPDDRDAQGADRRGAHRRRRDLDQRVGHPQRLRAQPELRPVAAHPPGDRGRRRRPGPPVADLRLVLVEPSARPPTATRSTYATRRSAGSPAWGTGLQQRPRQQPGHHDQAGRLRGRLDGPAAVIQGQDQVSTTTTARRTPTRSTAPTGGQLWSGLSGNAEKYSFFAVLGAPARAKMRDAIAQADALDPHRTRRRAGNASPTRAQPPRRSSTCGSTPSATSTT